MKKWEEDHGTKDQTGRVRSYPSMPEDVRKSHAEESEAAALAAFPMTRPIANKGRDA